MIPWQLADCRTREISNDNDGYCVLWDRDADVAYYRGAMGILLVYDVCDERSFNSTSLSLYLSQSSNPLSIPLTSCKHLRQALLTTFASKQSFLSINSVVCGH